MKPGSDRKYTSEYREAAVKQPGRHARDATISATNAAVNLEGWDQIPALFIDRTLVAFAWIAVPGTIASLLRIPVIGVQRVMYFHVLCVALIIAAALNRQRMRLQQKALLILLVIFGIGVFGLINFRNPVPRHRLPADDDDLWDETGNSFVAVASGVRQRRSLPSCDSQAWLSRRCERLFALA
jgi:uncharacterized membrane protein